MRTTTFEAINEARYEYFSDPALEGFVEALEYSAILDDRTTDLCQSLNGRVYALDSEEWAQFNPPNHYNCRSLLIPITQRDGWEPSEPTEALDLKPAKGFSTESTTYSSGRTHITFSPIINVAAPTQHFAHPPPTINFEAVMPDYPTHTTQVNVAAPIVTVESPSVTLEMPDRMTMDIASMPDRKTTSTPSRNGQGDITGVVQHERDA
jgi:SPP1 gp7 family putative phage head morphogenesis protein